MIGQTPSQQTSPSNRTRSSEAHRRDEHLETLTEAVKELQESNKALQGSNMVLQEEMALV
jgi:hypothetical protein